ncbi:MAG: phosphatidylserine decarboxylase [Verrucomicrobiota bacterium]|jgi:phosphatidylserine decarboxylase
MKHAGIARRAALKLIFLPLLAVVAAGLLGVLLGWPAWLEALALAVAALWLLFAGFTLYFFRDPEAKTPAGPGLVVSPGHGKVDAVEILMHSCTSLGTCHRISIFLSVIDVHVQNAPVSGTIERLEREPGQFLSALKAESALHNENVLIGFASTENPGETIGVRLIAGVLARRIVPFVQKGDELRRGERISLIQFGSRCDLYLPLDYKIKVKLGDKVVGGETIMAAKA